LSGSLAINREKEVLGQLVSYGVNPLDWTL
jgi:hypothetical protein